MRSEVFSGRAEDAAAELGMRAVLQIQVSSPRTRGPRSEEHTSELQSLRHLVCRLVLELKNRQGDCRTAEVAAPTRLNASSVQLPDGDEPEGRTALEHDRDT